jgi:hypothetical protein
LNRIKIEDLPEDQKISMEEMRKIFGGATPIHLPNPNYFSYFINPVLVRGALPTPFPRV